MPQTNPNPVPTFEPKAAEQDDHEAKSHIASADSFFRSNYEYEVLKWRFIIRFNIKKLIFKIVSPLI